MKYRSLILFVAIIGINACATASEKHSEEKHSDAKKVIKIILGSTRQGRSSEKIGNALLQLAHKRTDAQFELVDLRDYKLPFLDDAINPKSRTIITDPAIKKWSDAIKEADAFIIVVPQYNAGYPGVLKNALDLLYKEWNGKRVGFVGYSGGKKGGAIVVAQLREVAEELRMIPVPAELLIPRAGQAFDEKGQLLEVHTEKTFNVMIDQLLE